MNTKPSPKQNITLEEVTERKEEIKRQIDDQGRIITLTVRDIFAPAPSDSATNTLMNSFTKGLAIYDGVMTGIKIMRRLKAFFRRMK